MAFFLYVNGPLQGSFPKNRSDACVSLGYGRTTIRSLITEVLLWRVHWQVGWPDVSSSLPLRKILEVHFLLLSQEQTVIGDSSENQQAEETCTS